MIDLTLNEEQRQIIDSVRGTLERLQSRKMPLAEQWAELARHGMFGLSLDGAEQGAGFSIIEEVLLAHEVGRSVAHSGYLATAAAALLSSSLRDQIISGNLIVSFGLRSESSDGRCWLMDATEADFVLMKAKRLWQIESIGNFSDREQVESLDGSPLETATIGASRTSPADGDQLDLRIELLFCGALCGIAERAKEMSVDYAGTREQFGRPIGSFQAVAHHCADSAMRVEAALAQLYLAAISVRDDAPDAALQVAAAGHIADDAAFRNASVNIRIHGGMGFSSETGADKLLKRTLTYRRLSLGEHWRNQNLL